MHGVIEKVIVHLADPEWVKQASELGMIASLRLPSEPPAALLARGIHHITLTIATGKRITNDMGGQTSGFAVCAQRVSRMSGGSLTMTLMRSSRILLKKAWICWKKKDTVSKIDIAIFLAG